MAWEFPAVSQTRVEFWKQPQFTKSGMWWFTLIFGFFGLHHLYLRSPQTAIIFLIANFFSLGFLWFYDLIQLSNVGESLENLNRHGLNTHLYNMGLAQGMWKEPESLMNSIGKMTGSGNGKKMTMALQIHSGSYYTVSSSQSPL
jgi:TM2 domain-containing membrane protein YozV